MIGVDCFLMNKNSVYYDKIYSVLLFIEGCKDCSILILSVTSINSIMFQVSTLIRGGRKCVYMASNQHSAI